MGESLLDSIAQLRPEAVLITGDFTQRAKREQFEAAAVFLKKLGALCDRIVACPGNHDIALFRLWERVFHPFRLYRRYIHPDLNQVSDLPDARLVALNTVRPLSRIVEGEISARQIEKLRQTLSQVPSKLFRVLALHHPPDIPRDPRERSSLQKSFVAACIDQEVDIVLSGHVHESRVFELGKSPDELPGARTLLIGCGTSTSGRGRWSEKDQNTFRLIEGDARSIKISTLRYAAEEKAFGIRAQETFAKVFR